MTHPDATTGKSAGELADECWHDLIEKDDRTSPEEYPDHALITKDELAVYISRAHRSLSYGLGMREITDGMIEAGARALHEISTYRGYDKETLDREWLRMERIYKAHVKAVLDAALSQPAAQPSLDQVVEQVCDALASQPAAREEGE